jgi:hypothetical protein
MFSTSIHDGHYCFEYRYNSIQVKNYMNSIHAEVVSYEALHITQF